MLWLRGYLVVPNFLPEDDCIQIRKYIESIKWPVGSCNMPHGSLCSSSDREVFDFSKCYFDVQIEKSLSILKGYLRDEFLDVGLRTIQLRMHSPIWHIDAQTFNNDQPLIARDKRFKLFKCGVYLQNELESGGGTLEVRQPFLGGGVKNLMYSGHCKILNKSIVELIVKLLGIVSDSSQLINRRLSLNAGDLVIFSGFLKHRASQRRDCSSLITDSLTNYFVDTSDSLGKIMLQWEFVNDNVFGNRYRTHALLKHKTVRQ